MLNSLINISLKNRFAVLLLAGLLVYVGVQSARSLPLDAFPDTTPNQVHARGGRVCANEEVPRLPQSKIDGQRCGSKLKYFSGSAVDDLRCNLVDDFLD